MVYFAPQAKNLGYKRYKVVYFAPQAKIFGNKSGKFCAADENFWG
jgi:hypothetical protein